ncbi:hypothetical protein Harman_33300 [Haloarcula mannanilytica]|uniref:Glycosyl transferase family 1 domain-containing protein n=2 Tax=Haloarcula mannanilytica TaxID=2509225 RepID=A0A4C2ELY2_9EURY|nr:hypothetical protein Harman_33300 [Haloarcula mannanilytica]
MNRGGAEAVCMSVMEALENDNKIDLITLNKPDMEFLNEFFDACVYSITIRQPNFAYRNLSDLSTWFGEIFEYGKFGLLDSALLNQYMSNCSVDYDLVISTKNIIQLPSTPCINYVHFPEFFKSEVDSENTKNRNASWFQQICRLIGNISRECENCCYLTNSEYTSRCLQRAVDCKPTVVNPPINTPQIISEHDRENGFVTIGRLEPEKRTIEMIQIIREVRNRGHDVHLHIVGQKYNRKYSRRVQDLQKDFSFIHLEGELSRDSLISLLSDHRYGIHGRRYEHYGMSVAEMVRLGLVPFVPGNGGQSEIVGNLLELTYNEPKEAVEKIDNIISSDSYGDIRYKLRESSSINDKSEFKTKIQETIAKEVGEF